MLLGMAMGRGMGSDSVNRDTSSDQTSDVGVTALSAISPWQEKLALHFNSFSVLSFWVLVSLLIFIVQWLAVRLTHSHAHGLGAFGLYCSLIAIFGYLPSYNRARLVLLKESLRGFVALDPPRFSSWYDLEIGRIFSLTRDFLAFIAIGIPFTAVLLKTTAYFQHERPWFGNTFSDAFAVVAFLIFIFLACHYVAFSVGVIRFVHHLAGLQICVPVHQHHSLGIRAVGKTMLNFATQLLLLLSVCYIGIWMSPLPLNWLTLIVVLTAAAIVLTFFLWPQIGLHSLMVRAKANRLRQLMPQVEKALNDVIASPTSETIAHFDRLEELQLRLRNGDEWPFDLNGIVQLIGTGSVPIVLFFLEKFVL